jgi:hypothetical protein
LVPEERQTPCVEFLGAIKDLIKMNPGPILVIDEIPFFNGFVEPEIIIVLVWDKALERPGGKLAAPAFPYITLVNQKNFFRAALFRLDRCETSRSTTAYD